MKRITVLLVVCLFAASSVFAAVDFSGSLSAGYTTTREIAATLQGGQVNHGIN